jgi:hypothetical protein
VTGEISERFKIGFAKTTRENGVLRISVAKLMFVKFSSACCFKIAVWTQKRHFACGKLSTYVLSS